MFTDSTAKHIYGALTSMGYLQYNTGAVTLCYCCCKFVLVFYFTVAGLFAVYSIRIEFLLFTFCSLPHSNRWSICVCVCVCLFYLTVFFFSRKILFDLRIVECDALANDTRTKPNQFRICNCVQTYMYCSVRLCMFVLYCLSVGIMAKIIAFYLNKKHRTWPLKERES